jgi:hypothetical protein
LATLFIFRVGRRTDPLRNCEILTTYTGQLQCRHNTVNMAAPRSVRTKEEIAVTQFLWAEGVPGREIHLSLSAQHANGALPQRSVCQWITRFKSGLTSVTDEE